MAVMVIMVAMDIMVVMVVVAMIIILVLVALSRFMEAYRQGATGDTVLAKTKEMKRYHRVPLRIDPQPRVGYDRNRGRQALENIKGILIAKGRTEVIK